MIACFEFAPITDRELLKHNINLSWIPGSQECETDLRVVFVRLEQLFCHKT